MSEPETKPSEDGGGEQKATASTQAVTEENAKAPEVPEAAPEETRKPKKDKWKAFQKFMYNKDAGEVMGRTGLSWFKIFIFYVVFYFTLFAFMFLMLFAALTTMPKDRPKYMGEDSLIGKEPGLSYVPVFRFGKGAKAVNYHIFKFGKKDDEDNPQTKTDMAEQLKKYLKKLEDAGNTQDLGVCKEDPYGWDPDNFEPCVLVKINRVWGWKPKGSKIAITCKPKPKKGYAKVQIIPEDGFSTESLPYKKQKDFMNPFVMVKLTGMKENKAKEVEIECTIGSDKSIAKIRFMDIKKGNGAK